MIMLDGATAIGVAGGLVAGIGIDTLRSGDSPDYGMDTAPWGIGEMVLGGGAVAAAAYAATRTGGRAALRAGLPVATGVGVAAATGLLFAPYVNGHPDQFPVRVGSGLMPGQRN